MIIPCDRCMSIFDQAEAEGQKGVFNLQSRDWLQDLPLSSAADRGLVQESGLLTSESWFPDTAFRKTVQIPAVSRQVFSVPKQTSDRK